MADEVAPPQSHKQPSRKGKKAWRKNVDITEVQSGLENARDEIRITGGQVLADVPSDILFQTDIVGSSAIRKTVRKEYPQLRADEIIKQRSAVPIVESRKRSGTAVTDGIVPAKRRKGAGVSTKDLNRLKDIAYGGVSVHKDIIAADGTATYDPWAVVEVPAPTEQNNFIPPPEVRTEPRTLKQAPVALTASGKPMPHVRIPEGGRSYNPEFSQWQALLEREGQKEIEKERKRRMEALAEEERQLRIEAQAEEAERAEKRELMLSEMEESEWEGIQSDMDEAGLKKKRPQRMTPQERNKAKKRRMNEQLARHEAKMRARDEQLKKLGAIQKEFRERDKALKKQNVGSVESEDSMAEEDGEVRRRRRLGKNWAPEPRLEVVLEDELQDSLRRLKPEGNLLSDRWRGLIMNGKVAMPKRAVKRSSKLRKATEKWSSKDFKLADYV